MPASRCRRLTSTALSPRGEGGRRGNSRTRLTGSRSSRSTSITAGRPKDPGRAAAGTACWGTPVGAAPQPGNDCAACGLVSCAVSGCGWDTVTWLGCRVAGMTASAGSGSGGRSIGAIDTRGSVTIAGSTSTAWTTEPRPVALDQHHRVLGQVLEDPRLEGVLVDPLASNSASLQFVPCAADSVWLQLRVVLQFVPHSGLMPCLPDALAARAALRSPTRRTVSASVWVSLPPSVRVSWLSTNLCPLPMNSAAWVASWWLPSRISATSPPPIVCSDSSRRWLKNSTSRTPRRSHSVLSCSIARWLTSSAPSSTSEPIGASARAGPAGPATAPAGP